MTTFKNWLVKKVTGFTSTELWEFQHAACVIARTVVNGETVTRNTEYKCGRIIHLVRKNQPHLASIEFYGEGFDKINGNKVAQATA